ncbi:Regulator of Chromosome Condensation (RCC1) repeat protein [Bradymonas sediminis]|nr:Regulator of Chromosome Condensation (RCC1) repeat protein [Bradymonas sediminis]
MRTRYFSCFISSFGLLLILLGACSSDTRENISAPDATAHDIGFDSNESTADTDDATRVAQLILSPDPVEAVETQSVQVGFRAYNPEGLQLENATVSWQIEDTQIATVDASGLVSAREAGQTTLVASSGDARASVAVQVLPISSIDRIEIIPEQREVGVGQSVALGLKAYRSDDTEIENLNLPVEWQSDAAEIATIDDDGNLAGIERGEVGVLARVGELEGRAEFRVELKFKTLECLNGCYLISTEGKIYTMDRYAGEENNDGILMPEFTQLEVDDEMRFKSVYGGPAGVGNFSCALSTENRAYCWGDNYFGRIGVDFDTHVLESPTMVDAELRFKALRVGTYSTCGLTLEGALYCWGDLLISGNWIRRGLDLYETHSYEPVLMEEGPFSELLMTGASLCVQEHKTQIWRCMGAGEAGQLGNGERVDQDNLVEISAPGAFIALASLYDVGGGTTLCSVDAQEQQVWCWGQNYAGQRGQPIESPPTNHDTPQRTAWEVPMVDIYKNGHGFCGATPEREIRCWGDNSGCGLGQQAPERGIADHRYDIQPAIVGVPEDWVTLSDACVLTEGGDVWCWGAKRMTGDPLWPTRCEPTARRMLTF